MDTKTMREIDAEMSNFDHTIDDDLEEALRECPGRVYGSHAARNFSGKVFFDGVQFCEEVWRHGVRRDTIRADTLKELMTRVNNKYGWS